MESSVPQGRLMKAAAGVPMQGVKEFAMLRTIALSTVTALSLAAATPTTASDRFAFGINVGGGYPVYQPAPVYVAPRPVYVPNYGYGYGPGYGNSYYNPGFSFGYSNWGSPRRYAPYGGGYSSGYRGGYGHPHHHCH